MEKAKNLRIALNNKEKNLQEFDAFVETSSSFFNFDKYHGNILMAIRKIIETAITNSKNEEEIKILFNSSPKGLSCILTIDENLIEPEFFNEKISHLNLLSDEVHFRENNVMEIFFYSDGIHSERAINRQKELLQYFEYQKVRKKV